MNEKFMYYLWQQSQLICKPIFTTNERKLSIIQCGQRNPNSGPDFLFAKIQLDHVIWVGHVEMHLKSSDWYAHNHHLDSAYKNVILHVVWEEDAPVFIPNNKQIPTIILKNYVADKMIHRYKELQESKLWIPCAGQIKKIDRFKQMAFFDRLYVERLSQKTMLFEQWLKETNNDWENVLFIALAKGFGLSINGLVFAEIARSIPFSIIRKTTNHEDFEALLFGQASMLETKIDDAYIQKLQKKYSHAQKKYQLKTVREQVKFFRMRPSGFPTIRLSQLAQIYINHKHLLRKIVEGDPKENVKNIFQIHASAYWSTHHVFGKTHSSRKKGLSKRFLDLLVINTLLPFLFCYYRSYGLHKSEELISWAASIKAEKNSTISAFFSLGIPVSSALDSQALMQLKNQYCDQKKCLTCSFGHDLIQT